VPSKKKKKKKEEEEEEERRKKKKKKKKKKKINRPICIIGSTCFHPLNHLQGLHIAEFVIGLFHDIISILKSRSEIYRILQVCYLLFKSNINQIIFIEHSLPFLETSSQLTQGSQVGSHPSVKLVS
jgi:hypothetical protein